MKDEILKVLTESELFSINNDIKDFDKINIDIQKNTSRLPSYINIEESYINIIINELIANIYKNVIGYIKKESMVEYYDFLKKDIESFSESNKFTNLVYSISQKNIIINGRFSNIIVDSLYSNGLNRSNVGNIINHINPRLPYKIIENYNSIIFNDPFLKYNDNSLIVFDDILINISNLDILDDEYKISINCLVGFGVKNPKIYSVIESEKSEGYVDFIKRVRRGRIKGIVEE